MRQQLRVELHACVCVCVGEEVVVLNQSINATKEDSCTPVVAYNYVDVVTMNSMACIQSHLLPLDLPHAISNVLTAHSPVSGVPLPVASRDGLLAPSRLVVQSNSLSSHWHKYNYHFSQAAAETKHTVKIHYNKHQVRHVY